MPRLTRRPEEGPLERVVSAFGRAYPRARFVQVGANDGQVEDPLREQIRRRRWQGVMVEPVPHVFERLQSHYGAHPRIVLEQIAIADSSGTRDMYHLRPREGETGLPWWYDHLGSFNREVILKHAPAIPELESRIVTTPVQCLTFADLCEKHGIDRLELIQIDTEGYDFEIIKLIDFEQLRPRLVMYEHLHLGEADSRDCQAHLRAHGLELRSDSVNTIALDASPEPGRRGMQLLRAWNESGSG